MAAAAAVTHAQASMCPRPHPRTLAIAIHALSAAKQRKEKKQLTYYRPVKPRHGSCGDAVEIRVESPLVVHGSNPSSPVKQEKA